MTLLDALLVRHKGLTWAIPRGEVLGISRRDRGAAIHVRTGYLSVDEVLGIAPALRVGRLSPGLRRLLPPACLGLAAAGGEPVAVLDPSQLTPPCLHREGG